MLREQHVILMEQDADMIRRARKEEAADIAELLMLAWPVEEILESNGISYEQLHESMTAIAAAEETIYSYENTFVAEVDGRSSEPCAPTTEMITLDSNSL